jgi:hypothetical protein
LSFDLRLFYLKNAQNTEGGALDINTKFSKAEIAVI